MPLPAILEKAAQSENAYFPVVNHAEQLVTPILSMNCLWSSTSSLDASQEC
jgi:hypothetical protein